MQKLYNIAKRSASLYVKIMKDSKVSEFFTRLGMTNEMRKQVEDWRIQERDEETGKVPSFSEALRRLIDKGLGNGKH